MYSSLKITLHIQNRFMNMLFMWHTLLSGGITYLFTWTSSNSWLGWQAYTDILQKFTSPIFFFLFFRGRKKFKCIHFTIYPQKVHRKKNLEHRPKLIEIFLSWLSPNVIWRKKCIVRITKNYYMDKNIWTPHYHIHYSRFAFSSIITNSQFFHTDYNPACLHRGCFVNRTGVSTNIWP